MLDYKITGNQLKDKILATIAICGRADKKALFLLHSNASYMSQSFNELKKEKLIKEGKYKYGSILVWLTEDGYKLLEKECIDLVIYIKATQNGGKNIGYTKAHIERYRKLSKIIVAMSEADVLVGAQKPTIENIITKKSQKLNDGRPQFFLSTEVKNSAVQVKDRVQLSRSCGMLFSTGCTGLIYDTESMPMKIAWAVERNANVHIIQVANQIGLNQERKPRSEDSIFMVKDYPSALALLKNKKDVMRNTIFEAIWDKGKTQTNIRIITEDKNGFAQLAFLARNKSEDAVNFVFQEEEIQEAKEQKRGEAIITTKSGDKLVCFEFLTCNVTKLVAIRLFFNDMSEIGIACFTEQIPFVKGFLGNEIKIRPYKH